MLRAAPADKPLKKTQPTASQHQEERDGFVIKHALKALN